MPKGFFCLMGVTGSRGARTGEALKDGIKMQPCLCKKHFREVSNVFDKETAFAYALNDAACVICDKVIFIEGARRYIYNGMAQNENAEILPLPNAFIHRNM